MMKELNMVDPKEVLPGQTENFITQLCEKHRLTSYLQQILNMRRLALQLTPLRSSMDQIAIGESRICGVPDLPVEADGRIKWPTWEGEPVEFLAQLNLEDLYSYIACSRLPHYGSLLFFCNISDNSWTESVKVLYTDSPNLRRPLLSETPNKYGTEGRHGTKLRFRELWKLPHPGSSIVASSGMSDQEIHQYDLLWRDFTSLGKYRVPGERSFSWLFGYPHRFNCPENPDSPPPKKLLETHSKDGWELLLHLAGGEESGLSIGDLGFLSFYIHKDDLAATDFSRCFVDMEST